MGCSVLVVDDETEFARDLSGQLRSFGHSVDIAYGGAEALDMLKQREYDVALVDMLMQQMDGMQTVRGIRKMSPLVEVIVLTGHASITSGIEIMKLGAFDYLLKPCSIEFLSRKIDEACEKREMALQRAGRVK
ncbi:response regulator [Candidatus Poribacteria bacterium]|nr:response regulator [Candidatus Poribacteria bacterium]